MPRHGGDQLLLVPRTRSYSEHVSGLWYVCYGSNMNENRFRAYLPDIDSIAASGSSRALPHRWVDVAYQRYFAGESKTWGGAVAFLALVHDERARTRSKAYRIDSETLSRIAAQENGSEVDLSSALELMRPGEWTALHVTLSEDGYRGKYNVLLRLSDIEDTPAYTLTTSRRLLLGVPAAEYRELIEREIAGLSKTAASSVDTDNSAFLAPELRVSFKWSGAHRSERSTGFDSVLVSSSYAPVAGIPALLGEVHVSEERNPCWLVFTDPPSDSPVVDASLAHKMGLTDGVAAGIHLSAWQPLGRNRLPALAWDIPPSDVVHVHPEDAQRLGRWALLLSSSISAPFRVITRSHVPRGAIRLGYAGRRLLGVKDEAIIWVQPFPRPERTARIRVMRRIAEFVVGAPVISLRSTEGLVGDDGDSIIRIDSTALDQLGVKSGDPVIVSWGWRSQRATVLLQTESTLQTMREQLTDKSGWMARLSVGSADDRLRVPEHLRVWVSSRVRYKLQIPPDTVVRVRRSIPHAIRDHAFTLSLPVAGFLVAAFALERVSPYWVIVLSGVVLGLTFLSFRRRNGTGHTAEPSVRRRAE